MTPDPLYILLALVLLTGACGGESTPVSPTPSPSPPAQPPATAVRVLMVTTTAGFRHDSIETARLVVPALAPDIQVTATENLAMLTASNLTAYNVLFFALTSGELALSNDQKSAIVSFVSNGGGFLGAHSATDTLYEWTEYGDLIGAYFKEHPWTQTGSVIVESSGHPAASGLGDRFSIEEEFYTFRENPRPRVQVLLRLDAASVGASGDYPLAWSKSFGRGRVYYNALGHFQATWRDARFQSQLRGAIRWASGAG